MYSVAHNSCKNDVDRCKNDVDSLKTIILYKRQERNNASRLNHVQCGL